MPTQLRLASPRWAFPAASPLFLVSFPKGSWASGQTERKPPREVNLRAPGVRLALTTSAQVPGGGQKALVRLRPRVREDRRCPAGSSLVCWLSAFHLLTLLTAGSVGLGEAGQWGCC